MNLIELFNNSSQKNYTWQEISGNRWIGHFAVQNRLYAVGIYKKDGEVNFMKWADPEFKDDLSRIFGAVKNVWDISFGYVKDVENSETGEVEKTLQFDRTNFVKKGSSERGSEFTIYGTVFSMIREFLERVNPRRISFAAYEPKQKIMYEKFINKFSQGWHTFKYTEDSGTATIFILSN